MEATNDWRKSRKTWKEQIRFFYSKDILADLVLNVTNGKTEKTFQAHAFVLKTRSPVFEKMIDGDFEEKSKKINIDEVDPDIFDMFLKFIYFDEVEIKNFDEATELLIVAHRFLVEPLVDLCSSFMIPILSISNALRAHSLGVLYNLCDLKEKARQIMITETREFVSCEDFIEADVELVLSLLDEEELNIKEIELFKSVEEWLNKRPDKVNLISVIIPKVRFFSMTPAEFADGPSSSDLLTGDQKLAILQNMLTKNGPMLPKGFTKTSRAPYFVQNSTLNFKSDQPIALTMNHRTCVFFVDRQVTIKAFELSTCECSKEETIEYTVTVWPNEELVTKVTKGVKGVASVKIELNNPITIIPKLKYILYTGVSHQCTYKMAYLKNQSFQLDGVRFTFKGGINDKTYFPCHAIHFAQ